MPLFPLTTRSLRKTTASERLRAWDLDLQPGQPLKRFASHYRDCLALENLSRQIQAWVELDEADFHSICASLDDAVSPRDNLANQLRRALKVLA